MRKVLLVHALLKAPRLLILEDPFAGLDVATRRVLHRVIAGAMRGGTPVLVATNRAEDLPAATTHLLVIHQHQILAAGPKRDALRVWRARFGAPLVTPRTRPPGCEGTEARAGQRRAAGGVRGRQREERPEAHLAGCHLDRARGRLLGVARPQRRR
jgi:ABC-type multidrug transport system ATPase subunit